MEVNIYVANLGAYNRGYLVGEWISLPCYDLQERLDKILNGKEAVETRDFDFMIDEEWAVHDYECKFQISEYSNVFKLNEIAERIESLEKYQEEIFLAVCEHECIKDLDDVEEIIDNLDKYQLYSDIKNDYDLGYFWLFESGCYTVPDFLHCYVDCESFGSDISINTSGSYTSYGWLEVS
jgi:hypothetical protein